MMESRETGIGASINDANVKKETIVKKTVAQRQREYRMRKKIQKQLLCPKKIPKTNAQCQREFRQKQKEKLQQDEALNLARKKKDAERAKRYREKMKIKKQYGEFSSVPPSTEDTLPTVLIENMKETDQQRHDEGLIFNQCQIPPLINTEYQQVINPNSPLFGGAAYQRHLLNLAANIMRVKSRDSSTSSVDNEIKLLCPKCKTEVPHAAERIQEEQRKLLIAKVYHYLEQEYLELQKEFSTVDLTRLLRFRHRTALATGVSEWTVSQILKEEKARNEEEESHKKRRKTRKRPRQTHSSSEDDVSDPTDYVDDSDDQSHSDENNETAKQQEVETLVVKLEPEFHEEPEIFIGPTVVVKQEPKDDMIDEEPEIFIGPTVVVKQEPRHEMIEVPVETDPITTEIKAEPLDIADRERKEKKKERNREYQKAWRQRKKDLKKKVSKEEKEEKKRKRHRANQRAYYHRTKRLKENDENVEELFQKQLDDLQITNKTPEVTKRRGRKKTRRNDVTSAQQQSQGDISTTEASSSFPVTEELDESSLLGSTAVKVEEFEIHEEGFS